MELLENVRLKIGRFILSKKAAGEKRKIYYSNIGQVKKIGIVWDTSNTNEFSSLSRFYQKMHDRNIEVMIIGYYPGKNLPDQYTALRYLTIIRKRELNLLNMPVSEESKSFINNHFDILIDINFKKVFPLQCIIELSNARFKVGLLEAGKESSPLDLMMEIKSPVSIDNYLTQIVEYLEMINSEKTRTV
jgi:hypothetical protein